LKALAVQQALIQSSDRHGSYANLIGFNPRRLKAPPWDELPRIEFAVYTESSVALWELWCFEET